MTDPDTENTLRWMAPIFTRRRADGSFYFSDAAVRAFFPAFLISLGFDPAKAPPAVAAMVGAFAREAGVTETDARDEVAAKLRAHLAAHPLDPELLFEVSRGMREELATYSPEELARDVAQVLGMARPALAPKDAPPPDGSVRSGPLARFTLDDDRSKGASKRSSRSKKRR